MPRRYNFRKRDTSVKWIEDDTLKQPEEETESEDEDYEPPTEEEEESEEVSLVDEDEEDESEDDEPPQTIQVPISKYGRIKIEIDNRPLYAGEETDDEAEEEAEEEEEDAGGFLGYLVNKYVPSRRLKKGKQDEEEEAALELNEEEQVFSDELS